MNDLTRAVGQRRGGGTDPPVDPCAWCQAPGCAWVSHDDAWDLALAWDSSTVENTP